MTSPRRRPSRPAQPPGASTRRPCEATPPRQPARSSARKPRPARSPAAATPSPARPPPPAAWILARAATYLPSAQTATVLFGNAVCALTRPGEAPAKVTGFRAPDGTEKACRAIDALDGELGLSRPGTARLLVIVTDAWFVGEGEPAGAQQRITRLARAGCGVIILTPKGYASRCRFTGCQVTEAADPADAIETIARAAARALTA